MHPSGLPPGKGPQRCRACAWWRPTDGLCIAAAELDSSTGPVVPGDAVACVFFEATVGCDPCGACCREAFDSVPVGPEDEHTARAHPELIRVADDGWRDLARVPSACGTRCAALRGDGGTQPFRCVIYADRPSACRDLEPGSWNCWFARKRVGLWPPPQAL